MSAGLSEGCLSQPRRQKLILVTPPTHFSLLGAGDGSGGLETEAVHFGPPETRDHIVPGTRGGWRKVPTDGLFWQADGEDRWNLHALGS